MLDRHTEIIAHFIGLFGQDAEQALYRQQYDAFRAAARPEEELSPQVVLTLRIASDLAADKFGAHRPDYRPETQPAPDASGPALIFAAQMPHRPGIELDILLDRPAGPFPAIQQVHVEIGPVILDLPAPGGLGVVAVEENVAWDSDILLYRPLDLPEDLAATRTPEALAADLAALKALAGALSPVEFTGRPDAAGTAEKIETLEETFAAVDPGTAPEGATVTLVSAGAGTLPETGILIDGAAAEALPDRLEQILEARNTPEDEDDTASGPYAVEAVTDETTGVVTGQFVLGPDLGGPFAAAPQTIDTGGNFVMNAAQGVLAPVDAGVIVVGGIVHNLTAITQVNLMVDRDATPDSAAPLASAADDTAPPAVSEGHNLASVTHADQSWDAGAFAGGDRLGYGLAEIEGDLTITSYITQVNFIVDNDVVTYVTGRYGIEIGTGDNELVNVLTQIGLSGGYDMILVGGDMLNLVTISQLNLLHDNDLVVDADGAGGPLATAGNLLWNQAEVTWHGTDSEVAMSEAGTAALDSLGAGAFDPNALAEEALLEGREVPMLLTVSGNLVLDYRLEQINIVADADTVQLFIDEATQNGLHPIEVSTGGNFLANAAKLDIHGTDSAVMAQNGVYSDVVLYQAGMYDTDDAPLGPQGAGLASEAVAFLADGLIHDCGPGGEEDPGGLVMIDSGGGSGSFDTLGGMVT
ncbi:MAG: hypothetical protein KDK10_03615 [Maritimibacter sp.]|nr:hypothetical protein [Maritimibacter sp.]